MPDEKVKATAEPNAGEPAAGYEQRQRSTDTTRMGSVHAEAIDRYTVGFNKDRKNQAAAYEDLKFAAEEISQWDDLAKQQREAEARPILTINKCLQFVRQVTGDIRQLRPAVKVVPVDDQADQDVATKVLPGMLRYIEQRSDARGAYFAAADQQVGGGIGHCRVYTEYAAGSTYLQEICIGHIEDGISVVWDPDSIHPTRKDANWCFVPVDMSKKKFEAQWPDANSAPLLSSSEVTTSWFTDDYVRVCEYWCKTPTKREIAFYPTGEIVDVTDDPDAKAEALTAIPPNPLLNFPGQPAAVIEEHEGYKVERYLITAEEILEGPEEWPGRHIPIIPFIGEETKIGREIIRRGVLRALKDVQRLYNYAVSADAEAVALQPKAPYLGTKKNFEGSEDKWETANSANHPYLEYLPDGDNGGGPPQRVQPPIRSSGIADLLAIASGDMSAVTGIYPAALGAASNETSGKAIVARQREGDTGTFVYIENFGRGVQRVGEVVVDLVPWIYDTTREIRIVGDDGKIDKLKINQPQIVEGENKILHDLTTGTYEVVVEMGPSYSTKREEARDGMATLMQAAGPEVAQLYIDLFAKMQDWPLADKIAKRAQLLLPAPIQQMEAQEAGEAPPPQMPPPQPTPEQMMEAQAADREHELKQGELALKHRSIDAELQRIEADLETSRRSHEAAMAGHACTLAGMQHGGNGNGKGDARVDALADAVAHLNSVVVELAGRLGLAGGNGGTPPAAPGGMPPVEPGAPPAPPGAPPPTGLPPGMMQ